MLQTPGDKDGIQSHRTEASDHYSIISFLDVVNEMINFRNQMGTEEITVV